MDLLERYYFFPKIDDSDSADMDAAKRKALQVVMPKILEHELTPRQRICFRYKYVGHLTQGEIAQKLGISQPTVSRHLRSAQGTVNARLKYCYLALNRGLTELEKTYQ